MNSNIVIIYCRLSRTPDGVRGIMSLDSQEHAINIYISEKRWRVYSVLKTVGSAYSGKQEDLLYTLRNSKGKILTVFEPNRLTRNLENFKKIWDICFKNKHKIAIVNINKVYDCSSGYGADYYDLSGLIAVAEKESRDMGARISRTMQMKKDLELPYGQMRDNLGNPVLNPDEENIISLVKMLGTVGSSITTIRELIFRYGKTEGKDRFEVIEFKDRRGNEEWTVTGDILPYPMSPSGIKETLDYYEIKHRNRKWNNKDIIHILITKKPEPYQVPVDDLSRNMGEMDIESQEFVRVYPERKESDNKGVEESKEKQEWFSVWYDPKFGLPPGINLPQGMELPIVPTQIYIPKYSL
jgi:DNA invertase Pin-like site-specific DNA recombinase